MSEQLQAYHNLFAAVSQSLGAPPPTSELLLLYEAAEMQMLKEGFSDDPRLKMIIVKCGGDCNRVRMQLLSDSADSLPPSTSISNCDVEFFIVHEESNMHVDVNSSGDNVLIWSHHGGPNQRFTLRKGLLRASHSGMVLTCEDDGKVVQGAFTGAENQSWCFDSSSGTIRGYRGLCLTIDVSGAGLKEGCAVLARPFVAAAWQRFALVPSGIIPVDLASPPSSTTGGACDLVARANASSAVPHARGGGGGEAASPARHQPLPLETPAAAPALPSLSYQLPLPPISTPALQRLRELLERARGECHSISPAQRVDMTCEVSELRLQIPSQYHPHLLEVLRLLASNSRMQAKSPRPPYFVCNAAAPSPAATPLNEFFNDMQVPGLSTYNVIATNIACVRMPHSALSQMHPNVQALARHFHPAMTDLFFVVVDGRVLQDNITAQRPINIIAHRWVHDTLRHGRHAASRVKMMIQSPCGVLPSDHREFAVPFALDSLYNTDLDVYSHENEHGPVPAVPASAENPGAPAYARERVALYSPNNCWFHIIPGSPFAFFTLCVFVGQRACMCTMLVLIDFEHIFCKRIIDSLRLAPSLPSLHHLVHEFQEALHVFRDSFHSISGLGHELVAASTLIDPSDQTAVIARSMARYNLLKLLPANTRLQVYYFAWVVKGSPQHIHHDFGRMSFFCSRELTADQQCSSAEALQCVQLAANELLQNLETLIAQLRSVDPLPLHLRHPDVGTARKLFAIARRLFENPPPPLPALLHNLEQRQLDSVFHHAWRHMGHVEGDRVGEVEFMCESGSPSLKFYALVDSAMEFVNIAKHECSEMPDGAHQRDNHDLVAGGQDERKDHPPSSAAEQAASPAIPPSSEGNDSGLRSLSTAVAASALAPASAAAVPDADAHAVGSPDASDSIIK